MVTDVLAIYGGNLKTRFFFFSENFYPDAFLKTFFNTPNITLILEEAVSAEIGKTILKNDIDCSSQQYFIRKEKSCKCCGFCLCFWSSFKQCREDNIL